MSQQRNKRRNTKQRQLVLDAIRAHRGHPTAEDIYQYIHAKDEKISKSTIYRNLDILISQGQIDQIKIKTGDRFEERTHRHYHLLCVNCGAITDIDLSYQQDLDERLSQRLGHQIIGHYTVFEGLCLNCQRMLRENKNQSKR